MGLLFQSNPNRWDLRKYLIPGEYGSWFVSRYQALMHEGILVLLWEAKGSKPDAVKGLYGWGVTTGEMKPDAAGRTRIPIKYIERWVSKRDHETHVPVKDQIAPVAAAQLLRSPVMERACPCSDAGGHELSGGRAATSGTDRLHRGRDIHRLSVASSG